jgi:hypothetical protein
MLKIERAIFDKLGFDFEAALKKFAAEKKEHPFTIDVPAPSADFLVETAYEAGGYEIVEPEPEPDPDQELAEVPVFQPDPRKLAAMEQLKKLKGQKSEFQLEEIRSLLQTILEMLPV